MALNRLIHKIGPLHKQLYAYREGIGTTECLTDLLNCINNNKATIVFIDFEKAFELANTTVILYSLAKKGTKGHLLAWIQNYTTNRQARVKFQGHNSEYKNLENGTPQGGILSPVLFNILIENIAELDLPPLTDIFIFADDVAVVSRGPRRIGNIQLALNTINTKATELGLKINTNKTKAMSVKSDEPHFRLRIAAQDIEWVEQYKYLGVYLDKQFSSNTHITHLRERAKARLAPMKYMTNTKVGAQIEIQKLYYLATIRSLIDYSAPILVNLKETQYTKLEVLQNNALRLMLGAPMWTRLCNLQFECNIPTLKNRIEMRNIHITAKSLLSDRNSHTKAKITDDINKADIARRQNTYSTFIGNIIRKHNLLETFCNIRPDKLHENYNPKPWNRIVADFNFTKLPTSKHLCNTEIMHAAATQAINKVEIGNPYVIYTDGSVDTTTNTAGSAVYSSNYTANWRISNTASTLQTELVAIMQSLKYTIAHEEGPVVIHTDSMSSLQSLRKHKIKENKHLISSIHTLIEQHINQNRKVTFNWIPSHINIQGNEEADKLAKQTNQIDRVQINIQQSLQQLKNTTKTLVRKDLTDNVRFWVQQQSNTATWYYKVTELIPPPIDKHTSRELAVIIHRLRLGYRANWEIVANTIRPCSLCDTENDTPLLHYLLKCQHTQPLRLNTNIPQDIYSEEALETAYTIAKNITQNPEAFQNSLLQHPPPR